MKKFFEEFKKFISRGNVVDMAVGVIIGSAFSTIVTSLTDKIIMPLINLLLSIGGTNGLEKAYTFLKVAYESDGVTINLDKSIYIDWGAFITAIINFFLIAFVLFIIIKTINKANQLFKGAVDEISNKDKKAIRKAAYKEARKTKRHYNDVLKEKLDAYQADMEKKKAEKEEKEKLEAEQQTKDHPGEEALLIEIRDLLKANAEKEKSTKKQLQNKFD